MTGRGELLALLQRVRRRALLLGIGRVLLAASAAVLASLWLATLLLSRVESLRKTPWAIAALGAALVWGAAAAWWEWRRARPLRGGPEAVKLLALAAGDGATVLQTGADLARWGEDGADARGASAELAAAEVQEAARAAEGVDWRGALPARALAPWALRTGAVLLLCLSWALADAERSTKVWRTLFEGKPPGPISVGNLRVRYQPPAYTGLPESVVAGSSGAVEGLRGTRITLEGELTSRASAGTWEASDGRRAQVQVSGGTFRVSWILERTGTYRLLFARDGRALPSDLAALPMTVREDERPRVELKVPEGDLEVRSDAEVEVRFTASDDYHVGRAEIVLQGGSEIRIPLRLSGGRFVEGSGRFLPLAYPKLGEGVHLRVDAWDSDAVGGPKAGSSRSVYVAFVDRKKLLRDVEDLEERLLEAMLGHLGDHLEISAPAPADLVRLRARAADLLKLLGALSERVRQGASEETPLPGLAVLRIEEGLRAALGPFLAGSGSRGELTSELERDVLFLDRLLRNLRMEETLGLGQELAAVQRGLFDQLQAGGSTEDLLDRVDRIQKLLARMMERLARAPSEMPDAFANADAARDAPTGEIEQTVAKLRKALQAGDRAAAKKLAEELLRTLDRWMKALENAAEGAGRGQTEALLRELGKLQANAKGLAEEQERILRETRGSAEEVSRRSADALRGELRDLQDRVEQRLKRIGELARRTEGLSPRARPPVSPPPGQGTPNVPDAAPGLERFQASQKVDFAVGEVRQGVRNDLGRARAGASMLKDAFEGLERQVEGELDPEGPQLQLLDRYAQAAEKEIAELRQELEGFERRRLRGLGPREHEALRRLGGEQGELGRRTAELVRELEELARRTPLPGPGLPERARSAREAMRGAEERLGEPNPFGAVPPEGEALEALSEITKRLGDAQRRLQEGGGGGGFRFLPDGSRSGAGGRGIDRGRVEIPKEADAKELKAFREEVLKAMRQGRYPKDYEVEVERYYERLIR